MPEFKMTGKNKMEEKDLSDFTRGYIEAAFFTDEERLTDEMGEEMPVFTFNKDTLETSFITPSAPSFEMLADESLTKIIEECAGFEMLNKALLDQAGTPEQNGHDFWLTRNRHGAGFWDRGYGEVGDKLTEAAQKYSECNLFYSAEDNKIYIE